MHTGTRADFFFWMYQLETRFARIKIHDSSTSDAADPCQGSDHIGGRDAEGGQILGGGVFAAYLACWEEFFLDGKTWPDFLFPVLVDIARGGGVQ